MNDSPITTLVPRDGPLSVPVELHDAPPAGVPLSQDEWTAMTTNERRAALTFLMEEAAETTKGIEIHFPRVKYPASGTRFWEVPSPTGEPTAVRELEGVVVFKQPTRAYWPLDVEVGNNPPLCASLDGITPVASPTQQAPTCAACPHSQWGSGREGRGQACKSRLNTFVLLDGEDIPTLISLPPSALKGFSQYAVQLRKIRSALLATTTIFGLTEARSGTGISYTGLALHAGRPLTFREMRRARGVREMFESAMARRGLQPDMDEPAGDAGQF